MVNSWLTGRGAKLGVWLALGGIGLASILWAGSFQLASPETSPETSPEASPNYILKSGFWTTVQAPSVSKTVFKDPNIRLVFCVGLEGSGHHYMYGTIRSVLSIHEDELTYISTNVVSNAPYYMVEAMIEEPSYYVSMLNRGRGDMKNLAEQGEKSGSPGTVVTLQGMSSYPRHSGPNKAFQYLDFRLLAEVAEAEGVDLRLIYLKRSMKDMLISTTVHRHFQG